jgi:hypothetical protein
MFKEVVLEVLGIFFFLCFVLFMGWVAYDLAWLVFERILGWRF